MGICYKTIMHKDHSSFSMEELNNFEDDFEKIYKFKPTRLFAENNFALYDIDKVGPFGDMFINIIKNNCDSASYIGDIQTDYKVEKIY